MFSDMLQEEEKKMSTETTSAYHILVGKNIPIEVLHPNFSDLAGLVPLVVFAVRSAVDHQLEWEKVGMWDIPEKNSRKVHKWSKWDVCPNIL